MSGRPSIRVNQVGYLPGGPQHATWVTGEVAPRPFVVFDAAGAQRGAGRSEPWPERPEPTSGLTVHVLDLGGLPPGDGFRVVAGDDRSHPFRVAAGLYDELSRDAVELFTRLRCRHAGDVAVPGWTGPDAERLYPGWRPDGVFDVSGGWYDAGDYGKYVVSGAIALWQLLDLARLLKARGRDASVVVDECRFQLDWLLRMQVPPGHQYAGMAFHRVHGTEWSPIPGRPEDDPTTRVLHRPSTAATLHLAAVSLKASRVLDDAALVDVARTAWRAAKQHPDLIAPDDEGRFGGGPYGDPDLTDDEVWATAEWGLPVTIPPPADLDGFDFDRVTIPALLDSGQDLRPPADRLLELQAGQPWGQPYAPEQGWHWGSNGRILNNLVVLARAHEQTGDRRYRDGVVSGADYLFGRNALGQCYVTGYGTDATRHLRTRQFSTIPPGALAGGANSIPTPGFPSDPRLDGRPPQCHYLDEDTSETTNDICIRWNAPLAYITAYLSDG
ncbi:glycoside hydrolase family 9 protein [Actinoplanes sp. NPDC051470]|uniref:glycoside hydrolase family 9 protein n=1 Tax=Actinoplanes sp. NPDC051470 TaxID=3157224 RepID=UPI003441E450